MIKYSDEILRDEDKQVITIKMLELKNVTFLLKKNYWINYQNSKNCSLFACYQKSQRSEQLDRVS